MRMIVLMERAGQVMRGFGQRNISVGRTGSVVVVVGKYAFAFHMRHIDPLAASRLLVQRLRRLQHVKHVRLLAFLHHRLQLQKQKDVDILQPPTTHHSVVNWSRRRIYRVDAALLRGNSNSLPRFTHTEATNTNP